MSSLPPPGKISADAHGRAHRLASAYYFPTADLYSMLYEAAKAL